jgi:hypothetical protein
MTNDEGMPKSELGWQTPRRFGTILAFELYSLFIIACRAVAAGAKAGASSFLLVLTFGFVV